MSTTDYTVPLSEGLHGCQFCVASILVFICLFIFFRSSVFFWFSASLCTDKFWVVIVARLLAEYNTDALQVITCKEGSVIYLIFCLHNSIQIRFASLDLELHSRYVPGGSESIYDVDQRVSQKTQVIPPLPEDRFLCGFSHIFAGYFFLIILLYCQLYCLVCMFKLFCNLI